PTGNLYIEIKVKAHQFFKRKGNDIILNLDINIAQAVLGAELEVPTVDGNAKLVIPSGTQPGKVFTMRGKGSPILRSTARGDQMVVVNVDVPKNLTADQRKLFEQLATTLGTEVRPQEKSFMDILKDVLGG
ncbi:MAG: molecular chaperone DnaJ, partial [Anaerolinea sp.]|nr:molecular chaperone DnaJ [Anaerolinea sp.]